MSTRAEGGGFLDSIARWLQRAGAVERAVPAPGTNRRVVLFDALHFSGQQESWRGSSWVSVDGRQEEGEVANGEEPSCRGDPARLDASLSSLSRGAVADSPPTGAGAGRQPTGVGVPGRGG